MPLPERSSPARKVITDTNRCTALRMYPADGAFIGSDLAGEVVKLGPNLVNDIKIGDVVGASIIGGTFSASPWNLFANKLHAGSQVSKADGAPSQNMQKPIQILSGRFPRGLTPLKRSPRPGSRRYRADLGLFSLTQVHP